MKDFIKFGENVEGYNVPVLNEREIRASAGILFLFLFISVQQAALLGEFLLVKYFIIIFLTDMIIRVFVNPKFSPFLIMGRLIVRNQTPEYVGAPQKKFAWKIGVGLSSLMLVLIVFLNTQSEIVGLSCFICQIFLFFEAAFGICLGCKFYPMFYKEKVELCPGDVCEVKTKEDIQKTSKLQIALVFGFMIYVAAAIFLFNESFSENPASLWDLIGESYSSIKYHFIS